MFSLSSVSDFPQPRARHAVHALLALALCAPAAAYAQADTPSVAIRGGAPVCRQPHYIKPSDLVGIAGAYDLSNGDMLTVSRESRHFFAEMGKTGRVEIIPLNEHDFVEKGGPLRFSFDRDSPWTDVTIAGLSAQRPGAPRCPAS